MKPIFLLLLLITLTFADVFNMNSFEANFIQTVTNDKGNILKYSGSIKAMKPQYALWTYLEPSVKMIYIAQRKVVIIEPELEQAIIQSIHGSIDFFNILKKAKKIDAHTYMAKFQSINYTIKIDSLHLTSIEYKDEIDNSIFIKFMNQVEDKAIDKKMFTPAIPAEYDVING